MPTIGRISKSEDGAVEIQDVQTPSAEAQEVADLFLDLERKQFDFLNEAGKSLIERISTFLAILLGASALSNNFPPTYLKGDPVARVSILWLWVAIFLPWEPPCGPFNPASIAGMCTNSV